MPNTVYANMMEVCCKASMGSSICAFPDVCFTPPLTPATPPGVPIPYPNTGMASDCTGGSRTVKVSGQEAMLKNASYFKRSMGDEAGCAPKKNVVTSQNMGKVYFNMWSMDVQIEGENVVRNLDITTHNHASPPPGTPPMPHTSSLSAPAVSAAYTTKRAELNKFMAIDKRPTSTVGDGSTASALREEIRTGAPTKGKWHYKKAKELCNGYRKRDDDYVKEQKGGQISKSEADDLTGDTTEGYVRNADAVTEADAVASPPWPT
jgi:Toxin PAAR-like domain